MHVPTRAKRRGRAGRCWRCSSLLRRLRAEAAEAGYDRARARAGVAARRCAAARCSASMSLAGASGAGAGTRKRDDPAKVLESLGASGFWEITGKYHRETPSASCVTVSVRIGDGPARTSVLWVQGCPALAGRGGRRSPARAPYGSDPSGEPHRGRG